MIRPEDVAYERYISRYTDNFGMFTLRPWNGKDYDNENPHAFSAYMLLASYVKNVLKQPHKDRVVEFIKYTEIEPGLHRRRLPEDTSNVSHDEYAGITIMSAVIPELRSTVDTIVEYGKAHNWQYNDKAPGVDGFNYVKRFPIETAKFLYRKIFKKSSEETPEELANLQYFRQPRDIALYKLFSSKYKPNLFELIYLYLSFLVTAYGSVKANGGTRLLAYYKILAMEIIGHKNVIFRLTAKVFRGKMKKEHGERYIEALHRVYFQDQLHPIHTMVRGLG